MIRLLIVDDEQATIRIIKKTIDFEKLGIELIGEAQNGGEAMAFINSGKPPDIVITDMNMPIMDGVSLMRYLQENRKDIQIIVVSGYFDFPYTRAAIRANVQDYLLKPINPRELEKALSDCCSIVKQLRQVTIQSEGDKIHLEEKTYRFVLKETNELLKMIDYGNHAECDRYLDRFFEKIQQEKLPEHSSQAVYRLMVSAIQRYLAESDMEIIREKEFENLQIRSYTDVIYQVQKMVHTVMYRIEMKKCDRKQFLNEILAYLNEHYAENIRLDVIADKFHYNKEYLTTIFKKEYGMNIGEYMAKLKIEDAKRQLRYTTRNIDEIMLTLGYSDVSYFHRQFKKIEGISPGQYRKKYSQSDDE